MALNDKDVARIARLARIELTPDQRTVAQAELNGILHLIERLRPSTPKASNPWPTPCPPMRTSCCACVKTP